MYTKSIIKLCFILQVMLCSIGAAQPVSLKSEYLSPMISAHGTLGAAWLPEVRLVSSQKVIEDEDLSLILRPEIDRQLSYLVGNVHGLEGGVALHTAKVSDIQAVEDLEGGLTRYRYTAELEMVLVNELAPSHGESISLSMIIPEQVDDESTFSIFDRYGADCNPNPHRSYQPENYWYYFRPRAYYCPLSEGAVDDPLMMDVELIFEVGAAEKHNISPKYEAYWSDGRLVVTAVYALVGGLLGEQGQENYEMVFKELIREYGAPSEINDGSLLESSRLDTNTPVVHATFETPRGPLEVHLFLINSLDTPSHHEGDELMGFVAEYNKLTQYSDLVIYNGHARYGSDNAKLNALGQAQPKHYQLFFVNTCGSYTYGLPRVKSLYESLNQDTEYPKAYLDLILNGMPAMGHEIAYMNLRYIKALVTAEESYFEILQSLYAKQQMLVLTDRASSSKGDAGAQGSTVTSSLRTVESVKPATSQGCDLPAGRSDHFALVLAVFVLIFRRLLSRGVA